MSSDAPSAAWHPALMPNSAVDLIAKTQKDARLPEAGAAEDTAAPAPAPAAPVSEPVDDHIHDTSGVDDWFPEYESNIGWTGQDADAAAAATHEDASQPAEVVREEPSAEAEDSISAKAAKHASTISLARTVSHEVNWDGDDDDPEWDLPRTDTDPFKFMPPSDRSNSFPTVPPMTDFAEHAQGHDRPLPSSRAEEIMQGLDQELGSMDDEARDATASLPGGGDSREADDFLPDDSVSHEYTSGDLLASAEGGSGERYVEGVTQIPHGEAADSPVVENSAEAHDPFAEGDDGDDFFNQIENAETPATTESPAEAFLERKSTMQAINTLTSNQANQLDSPLEAAEEDGMESATDQAVHAEIQPGHQQDILDQEGQESASKPGGGDLDAQWAAVFGGDDDDDDFLLEDTTGSKDVDATAFLGEDDEGFLDDSVVPEPQPETTKAPAQPSSPRPAQSQAGGSRYLPTGVAPGAEKQAPSPYAPYAATPLQPPMPAPFSQPSTAPPPSTSFGYGAPPPRARGTHARSNAGREKGCYQSPYDLPMEVVKPRKRQSMQQLPKAPAVPAGPPIAAPPRSSSMQVASPTRRSTSSMSPPPSAHSAPPPPQVGGPPRPGQQQLKKNESFFEDLPMSPKPRPASRHSQKSRPSPTQTSAYGLPQPSPQGPPQGPPQPTPLAPPSYAPPPASSASAPHASAPQYSPAQPPADIANLVAPPRVSPYAAAPQDAPTPSGTQAAPPANSRYSPAVTTQPPNGAAPVPPPSKNAAAPPVAARTASAGYSAAPSSMPPPVLPHPPRTSSPLAHFEISHERTRAALPGHADGHHLSERRSSSSSSLFEPRLNRIPSLPPTKEDVEEDGPVQQPPSASSTGPPPHSTYAPHKPRQTPPPVSYHAHSSLSPPKKLSPYSPQSQPSALS